MRVEKIDYSRVDIYIHARNGYERGRLESCKKEPDTVAWIEERAGGGRLYDVGANVGTYSLIAAANGIEVCAIEPGEANYHALLSNIEINDAGCRIAPCRIALSDYTGKGAMKYSDRSPGAAGHQLLAEGDEIDVYRLDDWNSPYLDPLRIKIDVDGHEASILAGSRLTMQNVESALIEVDRHTDSPVCDIMREYGFCERSRRQRSARAQNIIFDRVSND